MGGIGRYVSHSYSHQLFVGFWVFAVLLFCFSTHTLKCFTSMSVVNGGITACKHFEPGRAKCTSRVFAPKRPRGLVAPEKESYSLRTVQREAFCCVFARMWGIQVLPIKGKEWPFPCLRVHGPRLCCERSCPRGGGVRSLELRASAPVPPTPPQLCSHLGLELQASVRPRKGHVSVLC